MVVTTPTAKAANNPKTLAVGCLSLIVIVVLLGAWAASGSSGKSPTIPIGQQAHLHSDKSTLVSMGSSEAAFGRLSKAVAANDHIGVQQLLFGSEFTTLANGASVLILGYNVWQGIAQVRVLDGPQRGQVGWVFAADVVP